MVRNLPANARDLRDWDSIPGLGGSPGGGHGNPLQYSCLENPERSLAVYSLSGCKESYMTEATWHTHTHCPTMSSHCEILFCCSFILECSATPSSS